MTFSRLTEQVRSLWNSTMEYPLVVIFKFEKFSTFRNTFRAGSTVMLINTVENIPQRNQRSGRGGEGGGGTSFHLLGFSSSCISDQESYVKSSYAIS